MTLALLAFIWAAFAVSLWLIRRQERRERLTRDRLNWPQR